MLQFGRSQVDIDVCVQKAEEFLVQVLKSGAPYKTMDELRYFRFCTSKQVSFTELPPTSHSIQGHILRAFYAVYMQLNCMNNFHALDPKAFGFEKQYEMLVPSKCIRIMPDDLPRNVLQFAASVES